jgi:transposase
MILDLKKLPSDTKILHQMIGDLSVKVTDLLTKNTSLRDQLALLKAKRFGKSSEQLDKQISDLELKIEESESNLTQDTAKAKRKPLPDHLPREDRVLTPDPICPSCGSDKGGDVAANIYSIIATCKINNINPQKYLHKLLSVIAGYNHKKIEDLLPWNLKLD